MAETFAPFFAAADTNPSVTYPDLDMLPIGDIIHDGALSPSQFLPREEQLLMTLWCFCGAPLIMGGNLPPTNPATLPLLTNPRLLAVHGQAHGRVVLQGASPGTGVHAWGAIPNDSPTDAYVALLNALDVWGTNITLPLASLPWLPKGKVCAVDLWLGTPAGVFDGGVFFATIDPHAAGAYRLTQC